MKTKPLFPVWIDCLMRRRPEWHLPSRAGVLALFLAALPMQWAAAQTTVAAAEGPRFGGSVVVATLGEPPHLNPAITTMGSVHAVTGSIYNGLVGLDERANPVPELAERWQVTDADKTYTFFLRRDVRWHDGTAFTSADVKFTFEELLLKYHSRTRAGLAANLAGIDTPDAHTVVFRFKLPYAPLLRRLDVSEAAILPRHIYQGKDPLAQTLNMSPVGTGPFRLGKWQRGESIVLERNVTYFRTGKPYLDKVIFRTLPNAPTATVAMEVGELDYLWSVPGSELPRLRGMKSVSVVRSAAGAGGSFCIDTLVPNLRRAPLQLLKVRQAINHAMDRRFIASRVYFDAGREARGPIHSQLPWFDPTLSAFAYQPERAAQLLDEAGYPKGDNGIRFKMRFVYTQSSSGVLAEVLKDQLKRVGIELALEGVDAPTATDRVYIKGDFDLGIASLCNGADPDIGVKRVYDSRNILPIPFSNGAGYINAQVDSLFDQAAQTLDERQRQDRYRQIQQLLVRDLPYFWVLESEGYRVYRSAIKGLKVWTGNTFEEAYVGDRVPAR